MHRPCGGSSASRPKKLPLAGVQLMRLYESALVRQNESSLIAQAAFVAAFYRALLLEAAGRTWPLASRELPAGAVVGGASDWVPRAAERLPSGMTIRAGAKLYVCPWVLGRDPCAFPDPTRFDPERHTVAGRSSRHRLLGRA